MRILLVTDAWSPQVNGVVVTLRNTVQWLERWGHEVTVLDAAELGGFNFAPYPAVAAYLARLRALPAWQKGECWTAADLARKRAAVAA